MNSETGNVQVTEDQAYLLILDKENGATTYEPGHFTGYKITHGGRVLEVSQGNIIVGLYNMDTIASAELLSPQQLADFYEQNASDAPVQVALGGEAVGLEPEEFDLTYDGDVASPLPDQSDEDTAAEFLQDLADMMLKKGWVGNISIACDDLAAVEPITPDGE